MLLLGRCADGLRGKAMSTLRRAMLDRPLHRSHMMQLAGGCYCLNEKRQAGVAGLCRGAARA